MSNEFVLEFGEKSINEGLEQCIIHHKIIGTDMLMVFHELSPGEIVTDRYRACFFKYVNMLHGETMSMKTTENSANFMDENFIAILITCELLCNYAKTTAVPPPNIPRNIVFYTTRPRYCRSMIRKVAALCRTVKLKDHCLGPLDMGCTEHSISLENKLTGEKNTLFCYRATEENLAYMGPYVHCDTVICANAARIGADLVIEMEKTCRESDKRFLCLTGGYVGGAVRDALFPANQRD